MEKMYKARASSSAEIAGNLIGLTDKQKEKIVELQNKEKLTSNQDKELKKLIDKRDNPPIPEGLKTHCKQWYKRIILGKKSGFFHNKYVEKGTLMEDEGIDLAAKVLGYPMLIKNDKHFENDYFTGTPDIITEDEIIDIKCSWDIDTFPMFEDDLPSSNYYWQMQVYMALTGIKKAKVVYCLVDTPEHLIEADAKRAAWNAGLDDITEELMVEMTAKMTYDDINEESRVKEFIVERNDEDIEKLIERVKICRTYIDKL